MRRGYENRLKLKIFPEKYIPILDFVREIVLSSHLGIMHV